MPSTREDLEIRKLEAEIAKLDAERNHVRKWSGAAEFLKVSGAIVAAIIAGYAAITTYKITQLETKLAVADKRFADGERSTALQARDAALKAATDARAAQASTERRLEQIRAALLRSEHDQRAALELANSSKSLAQDAQEERARAEHESTSARAETRRAQERKTAVEHELSKLLADVDTARKRLTNPNDIALALRDVSAGLAEASERAEQVLPRVFIKYQAYMPTDDVIRTAKLLSANGFHVDLADKSINMGEDNSALLYFSNDDAAEVAQLKTLLMRNGLYPKSAALNLKVKRPPHYFELLINEDITFATPPEKALP